MISPNCALCGKRGQLPSQKLAGASFLALADLQRRSGGHLKHLSHTVLSLGRALEVTESTDAVGHVSALLRLHRLLTESKHI